MLVKGGRDDPELHLQADNDRIKQDWMKAVKAEIKRICEEFKTQTAILDPMPLHKAMELLQDNDIEPIFTRVLVLNPTPFGVSTDDLPSATETEYILLARGESSWERERVYMLRDKPSQFKKLNLKPKVTPDSAIAGASPSAKRLSAISRKTSEADWGGKALPRVRIIFKVGDDLRQDALVLQSLRLFQHLWEEDGLLLPLTPYPAVSTWTDGGMIGVVPNSSTLADIQSKCVCVVYILDGWMDGWMDG